MYCWKCGKTVQDGMPYCPYCGAALTDERREDQGKLKYEERPRYQEELKYQDRRIKSRGADETQGKYSAETSTSGRPTAGTEARHKASARKRRKKRKNRLLSSVLLILVIALAGGITWEVYDMVRINRSVAEQTEELHTDSSETTVTDAS